MTEHAALAQSSFDKVTDTTPQAIAQDNGLFEDAYSQNHDAQGLNNNINDSNKASAAMLPDFEINSSPDHSKQDANLTDALYKIEGSCVIEGDENWCITDQDKDAAKASEEDCGGPDVDYEGCSGNEETPYDKGSEQLPPCEIIGEDIEDYSSALGLDLEPDDSELQSPNYPIEDRKDGNENGGLDFDFDPNKITNV